MPPRRQVALKAESRKSPIVPRKPNTKLSAATKKEPQILKIFCIVKGESTPFSVEILSNKTVDDLKNAIQPKRPSLKDVFPSVIALKLIPNGATKKGLDKLPQKSIEVLDDDDVLKKLD
ncbi:hypothetical protein BGZ76_007150, partial [Entomortierella beljakovae]